VIAVSPRLGVNSMEELIAKKPKMRVSIAVNDCVDFAIKFLLKCHGISEKHFIKWGGKVDEVVRPSNPQRREGIISGKLDMVIDEGMDSWGDVAVQHGMKFLSYSEPVLQKLEKRASNARIGHDGINDPTTVADSAAGRWSCKRLSPDGSRITSPACSRKSRERFRTTPRRHDKFAARSRPAGSRPSGRGEILSGEGISLGGQGRDRGSCSCPESDRSRATSTIHDELC
jgi:hypothetical protein